MLKQPSLQSFVFSYVQNAKNLINQKYNFLKDTYVTIVTIDYKSRE
jgi:hypothetical protein